MIVSGEVRRVGWTRDALAAVELDDEPAFRPHEVDLRPRAADRINKLIEAEQRAELGVGRQRFRDPMLDIAQWMGQTLPGSDP